MSDYNFYGKHLNEAFRKARDSYSQAYNDMERARKDYEESKKWHKESREGENEKRKRIAELEYLRKKDKFEDVKRTAWSQFDREADEITSRFKKAIAEDHVADSDKLDSAALELMKSGIMTAADYENMVSKFDDNATMLRLASGYIRESADKSKDMTERGKLYQLADTTAHGQTRKEREWDSLLNAAHTFSGRRTTKNPEPDFVVAMSAKWDDDNVQNAINNF